MDRGGGNGGRGRLGNGPWPREWRAGKAGEWSVAEGIDDREAREWTVSEGMNGREG